MRCIVLWRRYFRINCYVASKKPNASLLIIKILLANYLLPLRMQDARFEPEPLQSLHWQSITGGTSYPLRLSPLSDDVIVLETAAENCFRCNVFLIQTPLNGFRHKPGSRATKTAVSGLTIYPILVVSGPTYLGLISDDLASRSGQFIYLSKNDAVCHVRHILVSF